MAVGNNGRAGYRDLHKRTVRDAELAELTSRAQATADHRPPPVDFLIRMKLDRYSAGQFEWIWPSDLPDYIG